MIIETSLLGSDSISTNRTLSTMVNGFINEGVVCDDDDEGVDAGTGAEHMVSKQEQLTWTQQVCLLPRGPH